MFDIPNMFNRAYFESHESFLTRKKAPVLYDKYGTSITTDKKKEGLKLTYGKFSQSY